jgi:four helix bundle protein
MNDLNPNVKTKYDLSERTERFGEAVIGFARKIPRDVVTIPIIGQFVSSGTSMGANYCEADGAESRKDFKHKIGICKKESKETKYWLKMIMKAVPELTEEAKRLWQETQELTLIFSSIYNSVN